MTIKSDFDEFINLLKISPPCTINFDFDSLYETFEIKLFPRKQRTIIKFVENNEDLKFRCIFTPIECIDTNSSISKKHHDSLELKEIFYLLKLTNNYHKFKAIIERFYLGK